MHIRVPLLTITAALALVGCGKGPQSSAETKTTAGSTTVPTTSEPTAGVRTIEITANDQMKFNLASIQAKPGEELRVVLTNVGTMPKEAMGHNWVLLKSGVNAIAFGATAAGARETDYIPTNPQQRQQILAHTKLLGPKQKDEITFKAPTEPGDYPFVCTFPGHAALMNGKLTVR